MTWKQALTRAITAELAAERAATQAEDERRQTWWATTWALASVPRVEWGEAQAEYVKRTGHSASTAKHRRTTGERLPQSSLAGTLPQPRFGREAAEWIGRDGDQTKVKEAVRLLAQAEKNDQSLREFHQALTGTSWTGSPENLTPADEDAVVEKVARTRPEKIAEQVEKPTVAKNVASNPQATKTVRRAQNARTNAIVKKRKQQKVDAAAAAQTAAAVDATEMAAAGFPSNSTEFNNMERGKAEIIRNWHTGLRKQRFTELDRHHMPSLIRALEWLTDDLRAYVEAEDDPYDAVARVQAERQEEMQRQLDEAEGGTDFQTALDEIERYANEGV